MEFKLSVRCTRIRLTWVLRGIAIFSITVVVWGCCVVFFWGGFLQVQFLEERFCADTDSGALSAEEWGVVWFWHFFVHNLMVLCVVDKWCLFQFYWMRTFSHLKLNVFWKQGKNCYKFTFLDWSNDGSTKKNKHTIAVDTFQGQNNKYIWLWYSIYFSVLSSQQFWKQKPYFANKKQIRKRRLQLAASWKKK